jgi:riboflavin synthase
MEHKMFTGIIQTVGEIEKVKSLAKGAQITIHAPDLDYSDVHVGDSIAVNGVCLTAIETTPDSFTVDVSQETLNCSIGFSQHGKVNLEKAMRLTDRLGGHMVSGHVDGVGRVVSFEQLGESWKLVICAPHALTKYISRKGSVTINGVSLTVNEISGDDFSINLIPHTVQMTTFKILRAGATVNIEVDMLARYVEQIMNYQASNA